ncbi:hypothetical protein BC941DRAFT_518230 [Chlamydoabsidia padenii]|nr:hypothetical protein BC941DRAFT_518230 [Chlamydoabsidia padenii]
MEAAQYMNIDPVEPAEAHTIYDDDKQFVYFVHKVLADRLVKEIEQLSKRYGKMIPTKDKFLQFLNKNEGERKSLKIYSHIATLWNNNLGVRGHQQAAASTPVPSTPVSSSPALSSSVPSLAASLISTVRSLGLSSLGLDNNTPFISPGEVRDTLNLTNLEAGYRDMITPQLTILATNILNMHADNRLDSPTKPDTSLVIIKAGAGFKNYNLVIRQKDIKNLKRRIQTEQIRQKLYYENKKIMELQYALYADNEIPVTSPAQTTEDVTTGHTLLEDELMAE